jgi:1,4-dihydroxy-2-naphthoate octaprenyltransferase
MSEIYSDHSREHHSFLGSVLVVAILTLAVLPFFAGIYLAFHTGSDWWLLLCLASFILAGG